MSVALNGLNVSGVEIHLPQPYTLTDQESDTSEIVKAMLKSMGVRPKLVARCHGPGDYMTELFAEYHGISCEFDVDYWGANSEFISGNYTTIRCTGTYSSATPASDTPAATTAPPTKPPAPDAAALVQEAMQAPGCDEVQAGLTGRSQ